MDVAGASTAELAYLAAERRWTSGGEPVQGRSTQMIPPRGWNDIHFDFRRTIKKPKKATNTCLIMSGRGWGKTRTGAHWILRQCSLHPGVVAHVVAPTYADLRGVIFEGPSGILATFPKPCVRSMTYTPYPELILWNGSIIRGFSSETPNRMRGPQATFLWGDELAYWYSVKENLANIDFSIRIAYNVRDAKGDIVRTVQPQRLYTTTPKPLEALQDIIDKGCRLVRGSTYENRKNLAADFLTNLEQYEGTVIGRQELHGELIDISESAIIRKSWLRMWPGERPLPYLEYVMVSLDTAFSEKTYDKKTFATDPTACTVWGVFKWMNKWNLILLEAWEEWLGFPELVKRARREMRAIYGQREDVLFKPMYASPNDPETFIHVQQKRPDVMVIEEKGSGISLRQTMQNEGIETFPYNPGNADKLQRLHAVSHLPHAGRIWIMEGMRLDKVTRQLNPTGKFAAWSDAMVKQLTTYSGPGTTPHDDWVDTCSQAWRVFADMYVAGGVDRKVEEVMGEAAERDGRPPPRTGPRPLDEDGRHDNVYRGSIDDSEEGHRPQTHGGTGAYDG